MYELRFYQCPLRNHCLLLVADTHQFRWNLLIWFLRPFSPLNLSGCAWVGMEGKCFLHLWTFHRVNSDVVSNKMTDKFPLACECFLHTLNVRHE